MRYLNAVYLTLLFHGAISAWVPGQWVDDAQLKIWDEFMASRGSDWSSAGSIASAEPSHDIEYLQQTSDKQPVQEFSPSLPKADDYSPNPAENFEEPAQIEDKFGTASNSNVALPCGCPYHPNPQVTATNTEKVKPSGGCAHSLVSEPKPPVLHEPLLSQPIQQSAHLSTPVVHSPALPAVESVKPSCGCLHASHPPSSQEPILVPVPPLVPQLPVETPVKSCGCSHHAPTTHQHIQPTPQNIQPTSQTPLSQSSSSYPQANQNCGCTTNALTNPPSSFPHHNPQIASIPQPISPIPQPIPAISQPKRPVLSCPCLKVPKRPIIGPLEHLNRPYSHSQNSHPSVLHHVTSSTPVQNSPQDPAVNSAQHYCGCSNVTPAQNSAATTCNQAPKHQSEKTVTNSQHSSYACQNPQSQQQSKPAQYCQQYQPTGQQHIQAANQNVPCRCSSCSKAYDWSNHSNGRKPLDWMKHLLPL